MCNKTLIFLALLVTGSTSAWSQPIVATGSFSSVGSGQRETSYGDLAADALRTTAATDIALIPSSALRPVTIQSAGLDSASLADVPVVTDSPSDAVITAKLTGSQVISALERGASRLPSTFGGFLQVSGIKVTIDTSKDSGSRIVSALLSNGTPLSPDGLYTVAMTQPLANGAMGYFQIWGTLTPVKTEQSSFADIISKYAAVHQPLIGRTDGRLTEE